MNASQIRTIASARIASCPSAETLARLSQARRFSVLQDQAAAWRTLGLSVPAELVDAVEANRPGENPMRVRMVAAHRRVFPTGCTSLACSYGC